jgi:hemolysin-activating ACP:hemolysin acyltransferase
MWSFFLEEMHLDVLYNISEIQLERRREGTRIFFTSVIAPYSGSNQCTPW